MPVDRETWSSRTGFVLAAIGAAVGLGSIWKFPYEVGANGGSAFVLCYLVGLAAIVLPLMLAELALGRRGGADPATSLEKLARVHGRSTAWRWVGTLGVLTGFLVLSFYAVIGGWTLDYASSSIVTGLPAGRESAQARFDALMASPGRMLLSHTLFMAATCVIVARGVAGGIEAVCRVLMPLLVAVLAILAVASMANGEALTTLRYLFGIDLGRFSVRAALEAVGLGFFSIGVGLGLMITYAAYAGREINLREVAVVTIVADTAISFLAGFAIFPIVFRAGVDPASGPGLMFVSLPIGFTLLPFGRVLALAFYALLFIAALASAISLLELVVAWLLRHTRLGRGAAAAVAAASCWAAGCVTVASFNLLGGWRPLGAVPAFASANFFEVLDQLTSNLMLPLGGLLVALFAGWALPAAALRDELGLSPRATIGLRLLLRYLVPALIAAVASSPFWL